LKNLAEAWDDVENAGLQIDEIFHSEDTTPEFQLIKDAYSAAVELMNIYPTHPLDNSHVVYLFKKHGSHEKVLNVLYGGESDKTITRLCCHQQESNCNLENMYAKLRNENIDCIELVDDVKMKCGYALEAIILQLLRGLLFNLILLYFFLQVLRRHRAKWSTH
jgi:hypothetical protein